MAIQLYTSKLLATHYRKRKGETRLGDTVQTADGDWPALLESSTASYVLVGIPEDIGIRANYGRPGATTAFKPVLESLLTTQDNEFFNGEQLLIAGEITCNDLQNKAEALDPRNDNDLLQLYALVNQLDERVTSVVRAIVKAGKTPLIIGGGHNNAFGNIMGCSQALQQSINVINCDPHLDFRAEEGRHSGNGFTYAYTNKGLNKYGVVAMHESYNNRQALERFRKEPARLFYISYEKVFVRSECAFEEAVLQTISFLGNSPCGIELDMDAITNVPSSARTSSGISPIQARQYVHLAASKLNATYLHIAEAAPVLAHRKADNKTGKLIAYLITDFIKAVNARLIKGL